MKDEKRMHGLLHALAHYFTFFLLVAFVITAL